MKPSEHRFTKLIGLARSAKPPSRESVAPHEVRRFARLVVDERNRLRAAAAARDPLLPWERAGNWALAMASAVLVLVTALRTDTPPPNPLDPFGPVDADEIQLF